MNIMSGNNNIRNDKLRIPPQRGILNKESG